METLARRRGPVVIAVIVVVALLGVTIASRTHHSTERAVSPTTDASHVTIDLNDGPGPASPLFPFRVGAQILTAGASGLRLVDTDTGRITIPTVTGLPPGPVTIVAHSGATVAARVDAHLYWFALPNGVAHRLDADTAFAAAQTGSLWLAGQRFATEVPGDSDRLPRTRIATPGPAIGATSGGLLVVTTAGVLLQPSTGSGTARLLLRAPATVIGVHTDRVAWVANDCGALRCTVHVTEIAGGATSTWLQLVGHPSPLAIAGTSAAFSPDGGSLAIAEPNDDVTAAATLVVANLRTRATTVVAADGQFDQPARPGSTDATGMTVDWTRDGAFVVLGASAAGSGRVAVMDPDVAVIVTSGSQLAAGTSAAAIGTSSAGPLDRADPRAAGAIDTRGPTPLDLPGLHMVGADARQVDVFDPKSNRVTTFRLAGPVPNAAGPSSIARVVGGWLVVRTGGTHVVVDLLPDGGGNAREVGHGYQVFASGDGRDAWIVDVIGSTVRPYDPRTATLGNPVHVSGQMVAADGGLVVRVESGGKTRLDIVSPAGQVRRGPVIDSPGIELLAGGGSFVAFTDQNGLHAYDVATGEDQVVSPGPIEVAALSPDGTAIAWIEDDATQTDVLAERLGGGAGTVANVLLGGPADRILIADNGTVLFTNGTNVSQGRADTSGSSSVSGLAPDPSAQLALG